MRKLFNDIVSEQPTQKQRDLIRKIEMKLLTYFFHGKTKEEASQFISDHIEEYLNAPTEKQEYYIRAIEQRLHIRFGGKTKQEASKFIAEYCGEYQGLVELERDLWEKECKEKARQRQEEHRRYYEEWQNEERKRKEWENRYYGHYIFVYG